MLLNTCGEDKGFPNSSRRGNEIQNWPQKQFVQSSSLQLDECDLFGDVDTFMVLNKPTQLRSPKLHRS